MVQPITRSAYYDAYYGNMQVPKFTGTEAVSYTHLSCQILSFTLCWTWTR